MTLSGGTWRDTPSGRIYVMDKLPEEFSANARKALGAIVTIDGVDYRVREVHHVEGGMGFLLGA